MSGAHKDYCFGRKNNWRRTMWNVIRGAVACHPRDALVLYLAGADDLDRPVAIAKGFSGHNLIAVERSKPALREIRNRGALAVQGDFVGAARAWSAKKPLQVIYGDFCCDLSVDLMAELFELIFLPQTALSVFAFNFQRGRDSTLGDFRASVGVKHRGQLLAAGFNRGAMEMEFPLSRVLCYHSYRSGSLTFDSVVMLPSFCNALRNALSPGFSSVCGGDAEMVLRRLAKYMSAISDNRPEGAVAPSLKRRVAAINALHTMRRAAA